MKLLSQDAKMLLERLFVLVIWECLIVRFLIYTNGILSRMMKANLPWFYLELINIDDEIGMSLRFENSETYFSVI
jgi:hypothetical protein